MGIAIAEIEVHHKPRLRGKSKYSILRTPKVMLDLLTVKFLLSYSTKPLQIFGLFGIAGGLAGGILGLWLSYERLVLKHSIANRPLLLLAVLLIVIGIQFITLGLMAEIMVRAYHESAAKKIYHIQRESSIPTVHEDPHARPRALLSAPGDAHQRLFPDAWPCPTSATRST